MKLCFVALFPALLWGISLPAETPALRDIAIVGISGPSLPGTAGQPQEFVVRLENRGSLPLAKSDISLSRRVLQPSNQQEFPPEFYRTQCGGTQAVQADGGLDVTSIRSGGQGNYRISVVIPQGGTSLLSVTVRIPSEDGPTNNNTASVTVGALLPAPMICTADPIAGPTPNSAGILRIRGNWFTRHDNIQHANVTLNGIAALVFQTTPVEIQSSISDTMTDDMKCTPGDYVVKVTHQDMRSSTKNFPVPQGAPLITGITDQISLWRIAIANFRPACGVKVTAALMAGLNPIGAPSSLAIISRDFNGVTVEAIRPVSKDPVIIRITVLTPYGSASKNKVIAAQPDR